MRAPLRSISVPANSPNGSPANKNPSRKPCVTCALVKLRVCRWICSEKNLESFPSLPLDGLRYAIDSLVPTVPNAKNLKAEALIDPSVLTEVAKGMP